MFDKLIESEPEGADFRSRRSYFMVSSLVVGIFFATAVVFSLYAAELNLGTDDFVLSTMLAPVDTPPAPPETRQPEPIRTVSASQDLVPSRVVNMSRTDEPTIVPTTTSVVANTHLARPDTGRFKISNIDSDPASHGGPGRGNRAGPVGPIGGGLASETKTAEAVRDPEPPPVVKPPVRPPTQSLGVVNGKAIDLPKPAYPAAAGALRLEGKVNVQVLIDETGRVISASAVSGHPILKVPAERAARAARFSPTYLSKVPVKVSGVIVYNFTR